MDPAQSSRLIANCPLCNVEYLTEKVRLVGERGAKQLFHCTCEGCGNSMLAIILETKGSISSVGLLTDLEVQDAMRMHEADPISSDDCIRAHRVLEHESKMFVQSLLGISDTSVL
ncbi:MAG: hypothetical protein NUV81_01450 [bacterium]|nr:hypothetical protein [bacterium]